MANSTMQNLLDQYTSLIKVDPRVFGTDIMSQGQFQQPFDAWTSNFINSYAKPQFLRYQYDPYMKQAAQGLGNLNDQIGLSGGWRNSNSANQLNDEAQKQILGQEQLQQGFTDQSLQIQDELKKAWSDPLYQQQLTNYYTAPWRNLNTGQATPQYQGSIPGLEGFVPNGGSPISPYLSSTGGSTTQQGQGVSTPTMPRNILSQYLKLPNMSQAKSPTSILQNNY